MATKKGNKKTIGAVEFEYTEEMVEESKEYVENFESDYELSMFEKYKHEYSRGGFLSKIDTFLTFFKHHAQFNNKTQEEILEFIKEHSQELRDMFVVAANQDDIDEVFPFYVAYELDEEFHLIKKVKLNSPPERIVVSAAFLFADLVCALWKKYKNESIEYKILTKGNNFSVSYINDETGEVTEIEEQKDGYYLKECLQWNNENRQ